MLDKLFGRFLRAAAYHGGKITGGLRPFGERKGPCCFFTMDFRWLSRGTKINSIGTLLGCLSPVPWRPGGT